MDINSNIIKIDKDINSSHVFMYGKEIDDFHTLKKDYLILSSKLIFNIFQNSRFLKMKPII